MTARRALLCWKKWHKILMAAFKKLFLQWEEELTQWKWTFSAWLVSIACCICGHALSTPIAWMHLSPKIFVVGPKSQPISNAMSCWKVWEWARRRYICVVLVTTTLHIPTEDVSITFIMFFGRTLYVLRKPPQYFNVELPILISYGVPIDKAEDLGSYFRLQQVL